MYFSISQLIRYIIYRIAGKFCGELNLEVWWSARAITKLKATNISYLHIIIIHMTIPYLTTKFKSTNTVAIVILSTTAKFNSRQYFQLYGISYFESV